MNFDRASFGERLKNVREAAGVRLKDMAEFCNLSVGYLCTMEHGRSGCSAETLLMYSEKTGMSVNDILCDNTNGILPELIVRLSALSIDEQKTILRVVNAIFFYRSEPSSG